MKKRSIILTALLLLIAVGLFAKSGQCPLVFEVNPNPMYKKCEIELSFTNETGIVLTIENFRGEVIRTLYSGKVSTSDTFVWYRDDADGALAAPGTYYVVVNYQNRYTSVKKTLILK